MVVGHCLRHAAELRLFVAFSVIISLNRSEDRQKPSKSQIAHWTYSVSRSNWFVACMLEVLDTLGMRERSHDPILRFSPALLHSSGSRIKRGRTRSFKAARESLIHVGQDML
jgi:hypothetical protein